MVRQRIPSDALLKSRPDVRGRPERFARREPGGRGRRPRLGTSPALAKAGPTVREVACCSCPGELCLREAKGSMLPAGARFRAILIPGRVKRQAVAKPQTFPETRPLEVKTVAVKRKNPVTDVAILPGSSEDR